VTAYAVGVGQPIRAGRWPGGRLAGDIAMAAAVVAGALGVQSSSLAGGVTLDELLAAGSMEATPSANFAVVGDSLTDEAYGSLHTATSLNALSGGVLRMVANIGVAGNTVAQVLARIDNAYTASPPGLAGLSNLGWAILRIGANDLRGGASIGAPLQASYQALIAKLLTYAKRVIVMAVTPMSAPESGVGVPGANAWLASYCATVPGVYFIDDTAGVGDGAGGWAAPYLPTDGIHYGARAAARMTADGAAAFAAILAPYGYASPLITDPADVYPAQPQWIVHPYMDGTSGTVSGGFSGQVPSGWAVNGYGSGFVGTCSIVASDDGNPSPWLRITPTSIGAGGGAAISITAAMAGRSITTVDPPTLEHALQVRFNAFDSTKFSDLKCYAYGTSNEVIGGQSRVWLGDAVMSGIVVPRIATRRKAPGAHASSYLQMYLTPTTAYTGAMGSIDIRRASVRG
jgi:lysophospholipase L1-like esterase